MIPFGVGMAPVNLPSGMVYLVAVSSLSPLGIFLAGWSPAAAALITWGGLSQNPLDELPDFEGDRYAVRAFREFRTQ